MEILVTKWVNLEVVHANSAQPRTMTMVDTPLSMEVVATISPYPIVVIVVT